MDRAFPSCRFDRGYGGARRLLGDDSMFNGSYDSTIRHSYQRGTEEVLFERNADDAVPRAA